MLKGELRYSGNGSIERILREKRGERERERGEERRGAHDGIESGLHRLCCGDFLGARRNNYP